MSQANTMKISAAVLLLLLCGCQEPNAPSGSKASEVVPAQPESGAGDAPSANTITNYIPASLCNIEMLAGVALGADAVALAAPADIRGWLADDSGGIPSNPALVLAGESKAEVREIPIQLVISRPDVMKAYPGKQGLENSGFQTSVDPQGIAPGRYHLYLTFTSSDQHQRFVCDNGRYVRIGD